MQWLYIEGPGRGRHAELLKEAERARLAYQVQQEQCPFVYRSAVHLVGSYLVRLGQRLERAGISRTATPSTSITVVNRQ